MLQINSKSIMVKAIALIAICTIGFSFSGKLGGDVFEIYLNNKLISQQFVTRNEAVKTLQLDQSVVEGQVVIRYSHCGQTGTGRYIIIKDAQNRIVKEWHFADAMGDEKNMSCNVKEILALQKNSGKQLSLYYVSKELPGGRLLASIVLTTDMNRS